MLPRATTPEYLRMVDLKLNSASYGVLDSTNVQWNEWLKQRAAALVARVDALPQALRERMGLQFQRDICARIADPPKDAKGKDKPLDEDEDWRCHSAAMTGPHVHLRRSERQIELLDGSLLVAERLV